jgi:hypothetical protein
VNTQAELGFSARPLNFQAELGFSAPPRNNKNQLAGNVASTSDNTDASVWHLDSGATDHLMSDLARLHI